MTRLRILVVAERLPKPDRSSGERRLYAMLQIMAKAHCVHLCVDIDERRLAPPLPEQDAQRYQAWIRRAQVRLIGTGLRQAASAFMAGGYDAAVFEFPHVARRYLGLLRRLLPATTLLIDSVDVHFLREASMFEATGGDAREVARGKEQELSTYRRSDGVIVVTQPDLAALAAEPNMPPLYVVPNILPLRPRPQRTRRPSLLFIGGFKHAPNVDGILWFIRECWPEIQNRIPNAKLVIVGDDAPESIRALSAQPGITVAGHVPDTGPFLDDAAVSIAPLRFGAGMKGKVNEAMSAGLAVITTHFGVQGIEAAPGVEVMIAEDAATFIDSACVLLQNPARAERMGAAAQQLSERVCGLRQAQLAIDTLLSSIARNQGARSFRQRIGAISLQHAMAWRRTPFLRSWFAHARQRET